MTDQATIEAIIRERSDIFEDHFANSDAAGLARDYYIEDSMMSMPDTPLLRRRADIEGLFGTIMEQFSACELRQEAVSFSGDLAYELSSADLTPRDGGDVVECRYLIVWRKCADTWRVEVDLFAYGKLLGGA